MSAGPPFDTDTETTDQYDLEDLTKPIERYPDRDIRVIKTGFRGDTLPAVEEFGDFDPKRDDPDPDVWPIDQLDPGTPTHVGELICVANSFPAPHVRWVTREYLIARYGYDPITKEVFNDAVPEWAEPESGQSTGVDSETTYTIDARNESVNRIELTEDRLEAFRRIARLWNGEEVNNQHLIRDKCPDWTAVLGDLPDAELKRLVVDPSVDTQLAEAFGDYPWWEDSHDVYLSPQYILQKKVWYAPTQRGRKLINKHDDLPALKGDPNERLKHRVTVGLATLERQLKSQKVNSYNKFQNKVFDFASKTKNGKVFGGEVITDHHNWEHHRETYKKLKWADTHDIIPIAVFGSRSVAVKIINHWVRFQLANLPNAPLDSEPRLRWLRDKVSDAYHDPDIDWCIRDIYTTQLLWRLTLGSDDPDITSDDVLSMQW